MSSENTPLLYLLQCILDALHAEEQRRGFRSEASRRRFIEQWLKAARRQEAFLGMNEEFTSLRELLATGEKSVSIDKTLGILLEQATAAQNCELFRFRTATNVLVSKGWRIVECRFPENITEELINRRNDRRNHALQLTRTENAFRPTGVMAQCVTFHLLMNYSKKICEEVERIFDAEKFQVVVQKELTFDDRRIVRTLHIGTPSLPQEEWAPRKEDIWQPGYNSDHATKENYH